MPGFVTSAVLKALALHRQEPFELIHGHWAIPGGFIGGLVARATGVPLVVGLHGSGTHFAAQNWLYGAAADLGFRVAEHVMSCSRNLRDDALRLGVSSHKLTIIPYGVDADYFSDERSAVMRERLGIAEDAPVIGAIGRLVYKKGFDYLLSAMPEVLREHPGACCVIGGDGDLRDELRTQAANLGLGESVRFPGQVCWEDTPSFYAMCDVVTVPSVDRGNTDGLPNVLLEAMASGRPIVASDVAGIPQVVRHEFNGLLVQPGRVPALSQALVRLLDDPGLCGSLGPAARDYACRELSWDKHVSQTEAVYLQAVRSYRKRRA
jgi:glycosyltransferase involved in cell wall biosynthesis